VSNLHNIRIVMPTPLGADMRVELDGEPVKGVFEVYVRGHIQEYNEVTIVLRAANIEVEGVVAVGHLHTVEGDGKE